MSAFHDLSWVATTILERSKLSPGVDPFVLAVACGLMCWPRERVGAVLRGRSVYYDRAATPADKAAMVLHEVSRWALRWCGVRPNEQRIAIVEGALRGAERSTGVFASAIVARPEAEPADRPCRSSSRPARRGR